MENTHYISSEVLQLETLQEIISQHKRIALSEDAKINIQKCRSYLDKKMASNNTPIYGINTGFGSLCNVKISNENLSQLQENLVKSHACGTGEEVPHEIVKIMLLLKIQSLSYGHSGVQLVTVERLVDFFNNDILPIIYNQGSLGASGDLAPLAHLSLPLLGLGEVKVEGKTYRMEEVWPGLRLKPMKLQAKEGLALLNGTQFMSAYGVWNLLMAHKISAWADAIAALSADAFLCREDAFWHHTHAIRPHEGQMAVAKNMMHWLEGSKLMAQQKVQVQDAYSFRCIPQVHGATRDVIAQVQRTFETEINSVTDNPNIFADEDLIISGGNFHGQTLAMHLDFLAIALSEIASISERRIYKLMGGERDLPAYLTPNGGLNSGFMITQYTAAGIVSQNKQLCTPASVDSIISSNGQEDHVSMGANAATKCYAVVQNVLQVLGIELLCAAQAIEYRGVENTSPLLRNIHTKFREQIPQIKEDVVMYEWMKKSKEFLLQHEAV
ncbi:MAG: histidine ammonia-lyase [Bacteroidetes bacterium]|nr:histidine ammonia-lyase [Bacteroidota bacterium]